jgi:hypothetical protein
VWIIRQQPDWTICFRKTFYSSVLQKFSGEFITSVSRKYASWNMRKYVVKIWRLSPNFGRDEKNFFNINIEQKWLEEKSGWLGPLGHSTWIQQISFCVAAWRWDCVMVVNRRKAINEASFGIRNKLRCTQCQHSTAQRLAACKQ